MSLDESTLDGNNGDVKKGKVIARGDWGIAAVCFCIALGIYWLTAMPSIGMGDEGEMATAALHFGVMHPSGYPLWTILAGMFSALHFGNGSWELNLFSGLNAAGAVFIFTLMALSSAAWIGANRSAVRVIAVGGAMVFAFAFPVWSQAVIGKGIYSMHLLIMMGLLLVCYLWIRVPTWKNALPWAVFVFSIAMSNHHMSLTMAGIPILMIALLRRELFWEYAVYLVLTACLFFIGFAFLSQSHDLWKTAVRFFYTSWLAFLILLLIKGKLSDWKRGVLLPAVVFLGLIPYLYMPIASATNPPMNWSNTATQKGFYASVNRSQYWGPLSEKIQDTIGLLMAMPAPPHGIGPNLIDQDTSKDRFMGFSKRLWHEAVDSASPIPYVMVLLAIFFVRRFSKSQQIWLCILLLGAFCSGFLEAAMNPDGYDNLEWDVQKPWHGTFYACMFLISIIGVVGLIDYAKGKRLITACAIASLPVSALFALTTGYGVSSQSGNWMGWKFGHDILSDLPRGAVYLGGTDPGFFIPKYMVSCESVEVPAYKQDPSFDRRDLFILTQSLLPDEGYRQVSEMQYGATRPPVGKLQAWLGRGTAYPKGSLIFPTHEEAMNVLSSLPQNAWANSAAVSSAMTEWFFLHNRDNHRFFMEEQIPMPWSYKYARPHGLCYELLHDPQDTLPADVVNQDLKWWDSYIHELKASTAFQGSPVARRAFARLRQTGGNIYLSFHLKDAAQRAYEQELEICPDLSTASVNLAYILADKGDYESARAVALKGLAYDPESKILQGVVKLNSRRLEGMAVLPGLDAALAKNPSDMASFKEDLEIRAILGNDVKLDELVNEWLPKGILTGDAMNEIVEVYSAENEGDKAMKIALELQRKFPKSWKAALVIAKVNLQTGEQVAAYEGLRKAVILGGLLAKNAVSADSAWDGVRKETDYIDAMESMGGIYH